MGLTPQAAQPFECPTCGSVVVAALAFPSGWRVSCGDGHEVFPTPGTLITGTVATVALLRQ